MICIMQNMQGSYAIIVLDFQSRFGTVTNTRYCTPGVAGGIAIWYAMCAGIVSRATLRHIRCATTCVAATAQLTRIAQGHSVAQGQHYSKAIYIAQTYKLLQDISTGKDNILRLSLDFVKIFLDLFQIMSRLFCKTFLDFLQKVLKKVQTFCQKIYRKILQIFFYLGRKGL